MAVNATMPMYEYQCRKCKHRFERIQKFSDPILKSCPECGGTVDQLLTAAAVRFKGSGWYATDYASKSSSKTSGEGAGEKAGSESSSTGAEAKPEAKPKTETSPKKSHDKKK
jgi:putative FmdB family regulatory protein